VKRERASDAQTSWGKVKEDPSGEEESIEAGSGLSVIGRGSYSALGKGEKRWALFT